ncbi:hypothetical protein [Paenibacillus campinasensis]|uniref:Uncharacterized protein n=1 Tax=Paenibacillus campinasensis TaxID=66347 RepID=A0A268F1Z9_9BACL|nr:hypothetical protein [Paenibacillus campinasensis]PAD79405.1 hypothetical protein CHH67_04165 [Paenibacillus campinasensis]
MDDLLIVEGNVTPLSSKTHITYQFHIDEPAACLDIAFAYSSKALEDREASRRMILEAIDKYAEPSISELQKQHWERFVPLQNLLTLSLDDPSGFRGSAHRHPPEQHHLLTEEQASPGFIAGPLPSGIWKLTISIHCVVTPECHYRLVVRKGGNADAMGTI